MKIFTRFGNWIFHYRNFLFPLFYAALFIPSQTIFQDERWALITGLIVIGSGILVRSITIGLVYIIRGGANRQIHAKALVTEGIYSACRNPMYLGNILLIFGFGLFANSLLFLLVFFPVFVLFYAAIINAEEDFLSKKFGQQFTDYKLSSNSLLPRWKNLKTAFKGQTFKWKKVILKEYNSLFLYFTGICLVLFLNGHVELKPVIVAETSLLMIYLLVKYLKRKKLLSEN